MKMLKISSLALCALAGSALFASAAAKVKIPDWGTNYILNAEFTNNAPNVLTVTDVPKSSGLTPTNFPDLDFLFGEVVTDGAGKIEGVHDLVLTNLSADVSPSTSAKLVVDITGSITTSGKANTPNVKMSMKGDGYAEDSAGGNQVGANLNLNFATTGVVVSNSSVGPFFTNVTVIRTNSNGS